MGPANKNVRRSERRTKPLPSPATLYLSDPNDSCDAVTPPKDRKRRRPVSTDSPAKSVKRKSPQRSNLAVHRGTGSVSPIAHRRATRTLGMLTTPPSELDDEEPTALSMSYKSHRGTAALSLPRGGSSDRSDASPTRRCRISQSTSQTSRSLGEAPRSQPLTLSPPPELSLYPRASYSDSEAQALPPVSSSPSQSGTVALARSTSHRLAPVSRGPQSSGLASRRVRRKSQQPTRSVLPSDYHIPLQGKLTLGQGSPQGFATKSTIRLDTLLNCTFPGSTTSEQPTAHPNTTAVSLSTYRPRLCTSTVILTGVHQGVRIPSHLHVVEKPQRKRCSEVENLLDTTMAYPTTGSTRVR
ncbi:hypothetical protein IWQ62_002416 [Dispira parvispora]|uniref:Uncharacterized protein n=1 Tax=Dispira parvispora TaxID=1520584 RepID=A0A9W8AW40_9FUNG|nr:hypothetical protein IWQ62_002416 [Dispira parvispora]